MGLPKHWKYVQLNEIASLRRENIKPTDFSQFNYVGLEHIDSGESQLKRWGDASEVKSAKSHFYPNDVLYGKLRSYLDKAVIAEMEGVCSTDILVVTANPHTIPRFLVYLLHTHSFISHATATSTGVNHPRTSWNSLGKFNLALPPLPEQRAIAAVLGAIQEAKFARQKEIALERERKAALMDVLFSHGTKGEPRKQTEVGEIPESWEIVRLKEVVRESIKDGVHQTPTYVETGVPFITAKDIVGSKVCFASCAYISAEEHMILCKRVKPEIDDVLLTKVGTVGNVALVDTNQQFSIFVQVALLKPKPDIVCPSFLFYALEADMGQREINRNCAQSTMRFIGVQKISNVRVPMPSLVEQAKIAAILHAFDAKIAALEQETTLLDELFHAMLEELMTWKRSATPLIDLES